MTEIEEARARAEDEDFDPRVREEPIDMELVEELEEVQLGAANGSRTVRMGKNLTRETK